MYGYGLINLFYSHISKKQYTLCTQKQVKEASLLLFKTVSNVNILKSIH